MVMVMVMVSPPGLLNTLDEMEGQRWSFLMNLRPINRVIDLSVGLRRVNLISNDWF